MAYHRATLLIFINENLILLFPKCHGGNNRVNRIQNAEHLRKW